MYVCDENYTLKGNTINECLQDGLWERSPPVCSEVTGEALVVAVTKGEAACMLLNKSRV